MSKQGGPAPLSVDPDFAFCPACGAALGSARPVVCASCGRAHWQNAKPCAAALVVERGRLLLVRRARDPFAGSWDIPGGFCNPTELPRDAAVREVLEETGLHVSTTALHGMWMDRYHERGVTQDTLNIYFMAQLAGAAEPKPDPVEVSDIGWFAPNELPTDIAFPDHASAVLDAWKDALSD